MSWRARIIKCNKHWKHTLRKENHKTCRAFVEATKNRYQFKIFHLWMCIATHAHTHMKSEKNTNSSILRNAMMLLSLKMKKIPSQFNFSFWLCIIFLIPCYQSKHFYRFSYTISGVCFESYQDHYHSVYASNLCFKLIYAVNHTNMNIFGPKTASMLKRWRKIDGIHSKGRFGKRSLCPHSVWHMNYRNRTTITIIHIVHEAKIECIVSHNHKNRHCPAEK